MILGYDFFDRDVLEVAPDLVGKILVRRTENGEVRERIAETEAYRGEEDTACHASKGRTQRTEVMYHDSGTVYVYLCYGMHWLMNIVTGGKDNPQAVLIRAGVEYNGPAKLTKKLGVDKAFNDVSIVGNEEICIEDDGYRPKIKTDKRVGIDYATEEYRNKKWRFIAEG
ncbi:MAG: DNA-3-methyladenine glycosylase [Ruminococcus sp.]|nr:DNA-3-methyladenine glycosylase [Ruminococcus sp.]